MKRRGFLAILAVLALPAACGKAPKLTALPPGASVLAFGDSVTFGTGAAAGEDWPTLLAERAGWRIVNAGIPGDSAQAAKARLKPLLDEHRPKLVILEIGGNDFLRRRAQKAVKEDIREMIREIRKNSAEVVLVAVPELSLLSVVARKPVDAALYQELADEEKIPLIKDVFADILATANLLADQVHPNAAGYRQMAAGIHAHLQKIGLAVRAGP